MIIDKLEIRNFRSFGDIDGMETIHSLDLRKRGPVLISGEVGKSGTRSNGAGKTSIVEAIVWCLFGRFSDIHNPGDKVVNWDVGENCFVKITTADGYEILRTRKYNKSSDLFIAKNGSPVDGGDSTNANAQLFLSKLFNLDFNIFITSMFFGQASGSFLHMSDSKKKSLIENMFGLSKLSYYANVAKEKISKSESTYDTLKKKISDLNSSIESDEENLNKYEKLSEDFNREQQNKIVEHKNKIDGLKNSRQDKIDIDKLKESWNTINKSNNKLKSLTTSKDELFEQLKSVINKSADLNKMKAECIGDIDKTKNKLENINKKFDVWKEKEGKNCVECGQEIGSKVVKSRIDELNDDFDKEIKYLNESLESLNNKLQKINNKVKLSNKAKDSIQSKIDKSGKSIKLLNESIDKAKSDKMTISEAEKHNQLIDNINEEIKTHEESISKIKLENNTYDDIIEDIKKSISTKKENISKLEKSCEDIGKNSSHLTYIYRAHSDKRKLRSFLISGYVPILNDRLSYYFNELNIDSDISFTDSLNITSNRWPYEVHSGGEKKRVDLALMCALYDTFISIYGKQSNILVLDEIDKELDKEGVDEYVRLIHDDLSNRIDTILIISHKDDISYAFPSQIKVKKENDISYLEQQ